MLAPLKLSVVLFNVKIAPPPSSAELLMKLTVPLKRRTVLYDVNIAPPNPGLLAQPAELPIKLLVPLKLSVCNM